MSVVLALGDPPRGMSSDDGRAAAIRALSVYQSAIEAMAPGIHMNVIDHVGAPPALDGGDGLSTIRWIGSRWEDDYDPAALAVTVTTYDADSGRITDSDIVVNAERYSWSAASDASSCRAAYDLQDVLTHELGHAFGLAHDTSDPAATMFPTADACETSKRDLDDGDIDGLHYLYVDVGPASSGCAVGGRSGDASGALWIVGLLVLLRRRAVGLSVLALALAAAPAGATTLVKLSLEKVGGGAALVVQGTVRTVACARRAGRVYTDATVTVASCLRGPCPTEVTVRQLGGEVDGVGTAVEGTAPFTAGDEVVVFLRPRADGAFAPVGMVQGVFRVERGPDKAVAALIRDLRGVGFAGEAPPAAVERLGPDELRRALDTAAPSR